MATLFAAAAPQSGDGSNGDYFIDTREIAGHRVALYGPKANVGGTAQVETATVVGTIEAAGAGNATVIVTAAGMTGSPKTFNVAVANDDTASQVATKIRAALAADAAVTALFAVSGSGANVILTKLLPAANDATLNISIDDGTSAGLTAAPTSANTTAGVAPTSTWPTTPTIIRDARLRSGTLAPIGARGQEGDLYLNTVSGGLYGPKADGAWPAIAVAP
jgi:hypothetical protein